MADPKHQKAAPPQGGSGAKNDRSRDVEQLAAELFVALFLKSNGSKTTPHIAGEAMVAARQFYEALDQQPAGLSAPASIG